MEKPPAPAFTSVKRFVEVPRRTLISLEGFSSRLVASHAIDAPPKTPALLNWICPLTPPGLVAGEVVAMSFPVASAATKVPAAVPSPASTRPPAESKDEVAVAPKYAGPYAEKSVVEALVTVSLFVEVE